MAQGRLDLQLIQVHDTLLCVGAMTAIADVATQPRPIPGRAAVIAITGWSIVGGGYENRFGNIGGGEVFHVRYDVQTAAAAAPSR